MLTFEKIRARAPKGTAVVYFVAIGRHIKIGFSTDLEQRIRSFQTTTFEVKPLLAIPGDRELERTIHKLLADHKITRELFRAEWRIDSFINSVEQGGLEAGLKFLEETTPKRREERKREDRDTRVRAARLSRAEENAYYASLVAERKRELGW